MCFLNSGTLTYSNRKMMLMNYFFFLQLYPGLANPKPLEYKKHNSYSLCTWTLWARIFVTNESVGRNTPHCLQHTTFILVSLFLFQIKSAGQKIITFYLIRCGVFSVWSVCDYYCDKNVCSINCILNIPQLWTLFISCWFFSCHQKLG